MSYNPDSPTGRLVTPSITDFNKRLADDIRNGNPTSLHAIGRRFFENPLLSGLGSMSAEWFKERDRKGER